jgi:hypothetical protein
MSKNATIDLVYQSKLRTIDDMIEEMTTSPAELRQLLIDLFAKNSIKSSVSLLWKRYIDLKSTQGTEPATTLCVKDDEDLLQLSLIFHNYDDAAIKELTMSEVFTLMFTGEIDGNVAKTNNMNFLPAGFWQLPLLKEALIEILTMNTKLITEETCNVAYILPDDWEDPKYPAGLHLDLDAQIALLLPSISKALMPDPEDDPDEVTGDDEAKDDEPAKFEAVADCGAEAKPETKDVKTKPEVVKTGKKSSKEDVKAK